MRVRAKQLGYYGLVRRNEGEVFEMDEGAMKRDPAGKTLLPKWVEKAPGALTSVPKGTVKQGVDSKPLPAAPSETVESGGEQEVI